MFFSTYDYSSLQVLLSAVVVSIWTLQMITQNRDIKLMNLELIPTSAFLKDKEQVQQFLSILYLGMIKCVLIFFLDCV